MALGTSSYLKVGQLFSRLLSHHLLIHTDNCNFGKSNSDLCGHRVFLLSLSLTLYLCRHRC